MDKRLQTVGFSKLRKSAEVSQGASLMSKEVQGSWQFLTEMILGVAVPQQDGKCSKK